MTALYLLYFSLFFTLHSFAQSQCEQSLLTAEKNVVGNNLLIRASTKLEEDLKAIRDSLHEPLLEEQGFKSTYYRGVDQARKSNAVARYLRVINADPNKTHVPYFSDQINKTISDFEQAFRKYIQRVNSEFLEERLTYIWKDLKKEAQQRIKDQNVTYDWWATFNLQLSMFYFSPNLILHVNKYIKNRNRALTERGSYDLDDTLKIDEGKGITNRYTRLLTSIQSFIFEKEKFPEKIMFFTTDELGIMAFNRLEENSYFVGLSGSPVVMPSGFKVNTHDFFIHDVAHIIRQKPMEAYQDIIERIDNISNPSDREKAELVLFMYRHEGGYLYFNERLRNYYAGERGYIFQLRFRTRMSAQNLMRKRGIIEQRFSNPDDLQGLLPDSMNVNDKKEVKKFLTESADIFADILLAH